MLIVAARTHDAEVALATEEEVDDRFEPFVLPRWNPDRNFCGFVAAYARMLPLKKPSGLSERELPAPTGNTLWPDADGSRSASPLPAQSACVGR